MHLSTFEIAFALFGIIIGLIIGFYITINFINVL